MARNGAEDSSIIAFFDKTSVKYIAMAIMLVLECWWGLLVDSDMSLFSLYPPCYKYSLYALSAIFVACFFSGIFIKAYKLPSIKIITRFLDNSISKNILTALLLVAFIINFTWFIDILSSLFFSFGNTPNEIKHLFITLCCLTVVVYIFPNAPSEIGFRERRIIISSASYSIRDNKITQFNIEGLFKMFKPGIKMTFNNQEEPLPNITEFHIIPSHEYLIP